MILETTQTNKGGEAYKVRVQIKQTLKKRKKKKLNTKRQKKCRVAGGGDPLA